MYLRTIILQYEYYSVFSKTSKYILASLFCIFFPPTFSPLWLWYNNVKNYNWKFCLCDGSKRKDVSLFFKKSLIHKEFIIFFFISFKKPTFLSNHNVRKSLCGLGFWAAGPFKWSILLKSINLYNILWNIN